MRHYKNDQFKICEQNYFHVIVKATTGDTENNNAMNGFTAFGKIYVRKVKSIQ